MIMKDDWSKSLSRPNFIWLGRYRGNPLFWTELSRDDGKILFLCRNIIEYLPFHDKYEAVAWDNCTLRTWLNGEFYNQFSSDEKKLIVKTHLKTPWNLPFFTRGGKPTDDYVFLLSIQEAQKIDQSILKFDTIWWLRSPGYEQNRAADVLTNGLVIRKGSLLLHQFHAVRPAMNLDITGRDQ